MKTMQVLEHNKNLENVPERAVLKENMPTQKQVMHKQKEENNELQNVSNLIIF